MVSLICNVHMVRFFWELGRCGISSFRPRTDLQDTCEGQALMSLFLLPLLAVFWKRKVRQSLVPRAILAYKSKVLIQLIKQNSKLQVQEGGLQTYFFLYLMRRFINPSYAQVHYTLNLRVPSASMYCINNEAEQLRDLKVIHSNLSDTAEPFLHPCIVLTLSCLCRAGRGQVHLHRGSQIF